MNEITIVIITYKSGNIIYDLKRLGNKDSYLLQFDCVFLRDNSNLLNVKF